MQQRVDAIIYPRVQAQLKFFSREKGYGFFKRPNKPDIFVSAKDLLDSNVNFNNLRENDTLEFDLVPVQGKGGKAKNIKLIAKANGDKVK